MSRRKGPDKGDDEDYLSPEDIKNWTDGEIRNARRALDLRIKELETLASTYSRGEITPEQADEAHSRYYRRWGEALRGAVADDKTTDTEIIDQIDKARPFTSPRQYRESFQKRFTERS